MEIREEDFYQEFVKRTKEELDKYINEYKGDREFTMLLNFTLGLLLVPFEKRKSENALGIWDILVDPDDKTYTLTTFKPIRRWDSDSQKFEYYCESVSNLVRRLRNGLAHAHLKPGNNEGKWDTIKIWNWAQVKGVKNSNSKCTPIKSFVCPNRTNRTEND